MLYALAPVLLAVSLVFQFIGLRQNKSWALNATQLCWLLILVVAGYLTVLAWSGSASGKNMHMIGLMFIVWPVSLVMLFQTGMVYTSLRSRTDPDAKRIRVVAMITATGMVLMSLSGLLIPGW